MKFVNTPARSGSRPGKPGPNSLKANAARLALAGMLIAGAALPVQAARIDVRALSCGQAKGLVQQNNGVLLTLTSTTYDKIYKAAHFCPSSYMGRAVFVRTVDFPKCFIGYQCVSGDKLFRF